MSPGWSRHSSSTAPQDRRLFLRCGLVVLLVQFDRAIANLDRITAARHVDDRRIAEMPRKALGIDRRRGDHDLEIGPLRQQPLEVAEQEVDVERSLVRLVDDDRVVVVEEAIALRLGEQDAVGHQLDQAFGRGCDPGSAACSPRAGRAASSSSSAIRARDRARGDAARLRVADDARDAAAASRQIFGQLRRLARAGLAAHDHDRMLLDGAADLVARWPRSAVLRDSVIAGMLAARAARAAAEAAIFSASAASAAVTSLPRSPLGAQPIAIASQAVLVAAQAIVDGGKSFWRRHGRRGRRRRGNFGRRV